MPDLILRLIGDATSGLRAVDQQIVALDKLDTATGEATRVTELSAAKRVATIEKSIASQQALIASYGELKAAAVSTGQSTVAVDIAMAEANAKLNRTLGVTSTGLAGTSRGAKNAERDLNKMTRGVIAGSGALSGLGRSLAFSSTGFIAASLGAAGVVSAIHDAEDLAKAQESLRVAIAHTGGDLSVLGPQYEKTAKAAAQFGITEADATTGLARATTLTGNASAAQRAYQEALVISKATGKDFNSVLIATSKGQEGITTSLRRYGILVDSTSSGTEQFTQVMKRFGGQASANTTATEKLHAAFTNTLTTIGEQLLPTFERLAGSLSDWLTKMNKTGQLQKDVAIGMKVIGTVAGGVATNIKLLADAFGLATKAMKPFAELANGLNKIPGPGGGGIGSALNTFGNESFKLLFTGPAEIYKAFQKASAGTPPPPPVNLVKPSTFGLDKGSLFGPPPSSTLFGGLKPMKQYWKQWEEGFKLQNAQLQAALTKSNKDDLAVAKAIVTKIRKQLDEGVLHGPAYEQALQALASALGIVQQAATDAAQKAAAKAAAAKQKIITQIQNAIDPIDLQIALARTEASGGNTVPVLKKQLAAVYNGLAKAIADGNKQLILSAYQQIKSIKDALKSSVSTAVSTFAVPAKLALDIARDQALGKGITDDLKEERRALYKWISSHRKNIQGVTDAYNQIAAINSQLNSDVVNAYGDYKKASVKALSANLGLTADKRRELEQRLSQVGPGGTTPESGTGAAGYVIDPATGRPVRRGHHSRNRHLQGAGGAGGGGSAPVIHNVIDLTVNIDGKQVEASVTKNQQRRRRHNPTQTRGPNAATSVA